MLFFVYLKTSKKKSKRNGDGGGITINASFYFLLIICLYKLILLHVSMFAIITNLPKLKKIIFNVKKMSPRNQFLFTWFCIFMIKSFNVFEVYKL